MKIGIIGAGNIGTGLGRLLAAKGHEIVVSFSREPDGARKAAAAIGETARAGSVGEAARHGKAVILATPWAVTFDALRDATAELAGKILWDATNPLLADMSGLAIGTTTSGGEQISAAIPGAHVVKAIPPFAALLQDRSAAGAGATPSVFVCGDDPAARRTILALVEQIGADAVEAGPLTNARYTEPFGMLLVQLAYMQGLGDHIGGALLRQATLAPAR